MDTPAAKAPRIEAREPWWKRYKERIESVALVGNLLLAVFQGAFAVALVIYAKQAQDVQEQLVDMERKSRIANIWPVELEVCTPTPSAPLLGKITLINQGLHGSGLVALQATGIDANGHTFTPLDLTLLEFPEGGIDTSGVTTLDELKWTIPSFEAIIQPGERHQVLIWFDQPADELLQYSQLRFDVVPILGSPSAISIGETDDALVNHEVSPAMIGGTCWGTIPTVHTIGDGQPG